MGKRDPNIIRKGDLVRVVNAEVLVRCGYPKTVDDYLEEAKALLPKLGHRFNERIEHKIAREIAYGLAVEDHFGGRERTLHLKGAPDLFGRDMLVLEVKTVMTGRYYPPSGGGYHTWDGYEYDYEPGGLQNAKSHRIATLDYATLGKFRAFGDTVRIPVENLQKLPLPSTSHPETP